LTLAYDYPLSSFAFNSNLRRFNVASGSELLLVCDDWVKEKAPQVWRRSDGPKASGLRLAEEGGGGGDFQYRVEIVTGTRMSAGTDAKVGRRRLIPSIPIKPAWN